MAPTTTTTTTTKAITEYRMNWMGHEGASTDIVNLSDIRDKNELNTTMHYHYYERREQVAEDIRRRLFLIKRDLDLLPPEYKQRQEDERIRRENAEREALEEALEEAQRLEEEEEARRHEELLMEERRREEKRYEEYAVHQREFDGDVEDDSEEAVEKRRVTNEAAIRNVAVGVRQVLATHHTGYVSYVDGSEHSSLSALHAHNAHAAAITGPKVMGTSAELPDPEQFDTEAVAEAEETTVALRKKLDAIRGLHSLHYAATRTPSHEKDSRGRPLMPVTEADGDEDDILDRYQEAKATSEAIRNEYNARARAASRTINSYLVNNCSAGEHPHDTE